MTVGGVRTGQVTGAEQELGHDLPADELEDRSKDPEPFLFGSRMVRIQPGSETTVLGAQALNRPFAASQ
jgi:hypothetical protein